MAGKVASSLQLFSVHHTCSTVIHFTSLEDNLQQIVVNLPMHDYHVSPNLSSVFAKEVPASMQPVSIDVLPKPALLLMLPAHSTLLTTTKPLPLHVFNNIFLQYEARFTQLMQNAERTLCHAEESAAQKIAREAARLFA